MIRRSIYVLIIALLATSAQAEEKVLESKGMTVFGQSELPKVLYIVPWKRKEVGEIEGPQAKSLVTDVLTPIDPEIFQRQIRYYELMSQRAGMQN